MLLLSSSCRPTSQNCVCVCVCRVFDYTWTVNWRMLPQQVFLSPAFAKLVLALHLGILLSFAHCRWLAARGGLWRALRNFVTTPRRTKLSAETVLRIVFTGNFVGIVCARSLHYQFYAWYFHTLPFLLWQAKLPTWARLTAFVAIEACWNVYPSTSLSSCVLLAAHCLLLACLWLRSS